MRDDDSSRTSRPLGQPRGLDQVKSGPPARIKKRLVAGKKNPAGGGKRRGGRGSGGGKRRGGRSVIVSALFWCGAIIVIAAGTWFLFFQNLELGTPEVDVAETGLDQELSDVAGDRAVVLIFPEWDAMGYVFEERQIPSRNRTGEDLLTIMNALCQGPSISGAVSAIPDGTRALSAFYNSEDNSVVLDFSVELVTRHPGGTSAESATLTSILRTVALNFPDARGCTILVNGAQVETLAGHLTMDKAFDPRRWL